MTTAPHEFVARVVVAPEPIAHIDRRLFGSFVEHMGRGVYDGIYEPNHPEADEHGFRKDVSELVKELGVTHVRYPGGNFVSGFDWEDSVGPVEDRPRRLNLAWHSLETNEVGLHEFNGWRTRLGLDMTLSLNLGTRGISEALDLLEYCNVAVNSKQAELRASHGFEKPLNITTWFLGNEMDGPWQIGYRSAEDYGALASRVAKAMRLIEPNADLVLGGSSHHSMPTFGSWESTALAAAYHDVDFISCHGYYELRNGDTQGFLESGLAMHKYIGEVVDICDRTREALGGHKDIMISFDEWNVWYLEEHLERTGKQTEKHYRTPEISGDNWPVAPRLSEDSYTVLDAVVVGDLLATLIRNAARVKTASLSMLVNVMAPIRTEPGAGSWRQTTFYPFALTAQHAGDILLDCTVDAPTYESNVHGAVPLISALATRSSSSGETVLILINRSEEMSSTISVDVLDEAASLSFAWTLSDADPMATNTSEDPMRVQPAAADVLGPRTLRLPPLSWTIAVVNSPIPNDS